MIKIYCMELKLFIPDENPNDGFRFQWEPNYEIKTHIELGEIIISANKEGLISLANHLINLSQDKFPANYHFHLDDLNALSDGSKPLIIQKL
jgi:hypothetical protein